MMTDRGLDALRSSVSGPVLTAADGEYSDEAACWNAAVVHTPDVIVGATSAADVAAAVSWARDRELPVAVQATGHGATEAMREGVLVTTRRMQGVQVDPERRIARVEAGVKWRSVLAEAAPHGLIGLCGSSSDVGVVGYTLGGGLPLLGRAFGYSADRVRSIDVVTPDGRLHTVTADQEPELFQVLRGGKGNFGIVTAVELELLALSEFYGGSLFYPGGDAEEVLSAFRAWLPTLPDAAGPLISLERLPDMPGMPDPLRGRFVVHLAFAYAGPQEEGDRLLAPMRAVSNPLLDTAGPLPYEQIDQVSMDPEDPLPFEVAGALLTDFDEGAQRALLDVAGPGVETPLLAIELRPLGGALARSSEVPDAVSGRDAGFVVMALGVLTPETADVVPGAVEELIDVLRPWSTGYTLVNFHGRPGDMTDRARAWKPETYDVIKRAKRRYDPKNMMRFGHAVLLPSGEPVEPALPL